MYRVQLLPLSVTLLMVEMKISNPSARGKYTNEEEIYVKIQWTEVYVS